MNRKSLQKLTVKALRDLGRELSIKGLARLKKAELVEAILAARPEPEPAARAQAEAIAPPAAEFHGSPPPQPSGPAASLSDLGDLGDRYGQTRVVLLVQKPGYLYTYWEVRDEDLGSGWDRLGSRDGRLALRVHDLRENAHFDIEVHCPVGDWFFQTGWMDRHLRVDLGLKGRDGRFIVLASSNVVAMGSGRPSNRVDPEWAIRDKDFEAMYALSGGLTQGGESVSVQRIIREGWLPSSGEARR